MLPQLLLDYEAAGIGNEWFGWWDWYTAHAPHSSSPTRSPPHTPPLLLLLLLQVLAQRRGLLRGQVQVRLVEGLVVQARCGMAKIPISTRATTSTTSSRRRTPWDAPRTTPRTPPTTPSPLSSSPRAPPSGTRTSTTLDPRLPSPRRRCTRCSRSRCPMLSSTSPSRSLNGAVNKGMVKRAGINTVHFPEFFWDVTDTGGWKSGHDAAYEDFYAATPHHPAMITCESKKYEPAKVRRAAPSTTTTSTTTSTYTSPPTPHPLYLPPSSSGPRRLRLPPEGARRRRQADLAEHRDDPRGAQGRHPRPRLPVPLGRQAGLRGLPRLGRGDARVPQGEDPRQEEEHRQVGLVQGRRRRLRRRHLRLSAAWPLRPLARAKVGQGKDARGRRPGVHPPNTM